MPDIIFSKQVTIKPGIGEALIISSTIALGVKLHLIPNSGNIYQPRTFIILYSPNLAQTATKSCIIWFEVPMPGAAEKQNQLIERVSLFKPILMNI